MTFVLQPSTIFSTSSSSTSIHEDNDNDEEKKEIILIGSYNQFTPKCKIKTNKIGNGNIFHPLCTINILPPSTRIMEERTIIGNGNIFNAFVSINETYDESNIDGITTATYDNQVFFVLSSQNGTKKLMRRTNENGVRKNMADVILLLGAMKTIIQNNHTLLSS